MYTSEFACLDRLIAIKRLIILNKLISIYMKIKMTLS